MLNSRRSAERYEEVLQVGGHEEFDIESILRQSDLPRDVATADISYVRERLIDKREVARLTEEPQHRQGDPKIVKRLHVRGKALSQYLNASLICVLIRLPGVSYTIEIDPVCRVIVHWEWQPA